MSKLGDDPFLLGGAKFKVRQDEVQFEFTKPERLL